MIWNERQFETFGVMWDIWGGAMWDRGCAEEFGRGVKKTLKKFCLQAKNLQKIIGEKNLEKISR